MIRYSLWLSLSLAVLLLSATPVHADYQTANRQTFFNKTTDFFATVGKSEQDKKDILQERRAQRRDIRLQEEARRKRIETRKRMKRQQESIMQKINTPAN